MNHEARSPIQFGSGREERFATVLTVAKELKEHGSVDESSWRRRLAKEVAHRCGNPDLEARVYNFASSVGSARLTQLRVTCIGEDGEARLLAARGVSSGEPGTEKGAGQKGQNGSGDANLRKYRGKTKGERSAARKVLWMPVFVAEAERQHRAGEHISFMSIADGTCKALLMSFNGVYEFVRLHCNSMDDMIALKILNADGTPIVRKASPGKPEGPSQPPLGGMDPEEDEPAESGKDIQTRADKQFEAALGKLEPDKRTRGNLAQTLGKPPYVVDAYLYQNRDFAAKLVDGNAVFDPKFLAKSR